MSNTTVIPLTTIQAGSHAFGPVSVPQGVKLVGLSLDRSAWSDPAMRMRLQIELSLDGGATWNDPAANPFPIGAEFAGGALLNRDGSPQVVAMLGNTQVPASESTTRMVRGTLVNNLPMTTSGTLVTG